MEAFTPDEPAKVIFAEKAWLQGALLAAVAYGVELTLFSMSFYLLLRRHFYGTSHRRTNLFLLIYITIMFILSTLFYASNAQFTQLAFIDNRNFPGGPSAYEQAMFSIPIDELGDVCAIMTTWLADALLVWRCQVILSGSRVSIRAIMIFPYLLFLGSFSTGLLFLIQVSATSPSGTDGLINWTIPFFSISLSLNILLTAAIVIRLLLHRQRIRRRLADMNHGDHYTSVASMVIESASIFSIFSLLFLVPFALNHPLNQIFFQALSIVQINAMLLIIARVAQGKGWTIDIATQTTRSAMRTVSAPIQFARNPSSMVVGSKASDIYDMNTTGFESAGPKKSTRTLSLDIVDEGESAIHTQSRNHSIA